MHLYLISNNIYSEKLTTFSNYMRICNFYYISYNDYIDKLACFIFREISTLSNTLHMHLHLRGLQGKQKNSLNVSRADQCRTRLSLDVWLSFCIVGRHSFYIVVLLSFPYSCRAVLILIQLSAVGRFSFPYSCRAVLILYMTCGAHFALCRMGSAGYPGSSCRARRPSPRPT